MKDVLLFLLLLGTLNAQSYYSNGELKTLRPVPQQRIGTKSMSQSSGSDTKWYISDRGEIIGVVDEIVVQWENGVDPVKMLTAFGLEGSAITPTIWKIVVPADRDVFALAQELYMHDSTVIASPDMIRERRSR